MGLVSNVGKSTSPEQISTIPSRFKIVDFSCGEEHNAALSEDGTVFTWGYGQDGQLAHNNKNSLTTPKKVRFEHPVKQVVCGGGHTAFVTKDGELYMSGRGRDGQLGGKATDSVAANRLSPVLVESLKEANLEVA